jgi:Na+-translocating ferredoxin:NAD+ oxidoreductase RnfD subunit
MGIGIVLMVYAVAFTVAASVGAVLLGALASVLTRQSGRRRKRAIVASALFPFLCLLFAGAWFVAYATVNSLVFDRDPGLGDSWQTPLPNGYALIMIDTTDQGTVYNPKTQAKDGSIASRDDAVFGVRQLQVSQSHIFGARDSGYFGRLGEESKFVDGYFELETKQGKVTEFKSLEELQEHASSEGVTLNLRPFDSVFADYRTTWFDYTAGLTLVVVPLFGFALLGRWIWKIRRLREEPTDTGAVERTA